jgi:hypothetical protein
VAHPGRRRRRDFDIRRNDCLAAADRGAHRPSDHRVNAGATMLHLAIDAHQRALAIGNRRPIQQFDELGHNPLPQRGARFEQLS